MTVNVREKISFFENISTEHKAKESGSKTTQKAVVADQDKQTTVRKVRRSARGWFDTFRIQYCHDSSTTYIVKRGADISDALQEKIEKTEKVSISSRIRSNKTHRKTETRYKRITRGFVIRHGRLMKPYIHQGKIEYYDTGIRKSCLKALLAHIEVTDIAQTKVFHVIGRRRKENATFYLFPGHAGSKRIRMIHLGPAIARGSVGKVHRVWDINKNKIRVIKKSYREDAENVLQQSTSIDFESKLLKKINPRGKAVGLQRAPFIVFRMNSKSESYVGLLTPRYDSDLGSALSNVDNSGKGNNEKVTFTPEQIVHGATQLFRGVRRLNELEIINADIKSSNILIKIIEGNKYLVHIGDFDQAVEITEDYFETEQFYSDPSGGSSIDSLSYHSQVWIERTAQAITEHQKALAMTSSDRKAEARRLRTEKAPPEIIKIYRSDSRSLSKRLGLLKGSFRQQTLDIHTRSAAHIVYQMLNSQLNRDIDDVDFDQLSEKYENDDSLSPAEKKSAENLIALCRRCLTEIQEPPLHVTTKNLYQPIGLTCEDCLDWVNEAAT